MSAPKYCLFYFNNDDRQKKIFKKTTQIYVKKRGKTEANVIEKKIDTGPFDKFYTSCLKNACQITHDHENDIIKIKVLKWGGKYQVLFFYFIMTYAKHRLYIFQNLGRSYRIFWTTEKERQLPPGGTATARPLKYPTSQNH